MGAQVIVYSHFFFPLLKNLKKKQKSITQIHIISRTPSSPSPVSLKICGTHAVAAIYGVSLKVWEILSLWRLERKTWQAALTSICRHNHIKGKINWQKISNTLKDSPKLWLQMNQQAAATEQKQPPWKTKIETTTTTFCAFNKQLAEANANMQISEQ